jgi:hypothetical protein
MWTQTKDANWRIPYIGGWCEGYVEGAWGQAELPKQDNNGNWYTTGPYNSAMQKWNSNPGNGNHPGELPPVGKTVAVYFSLGSTDQGHTAISLDDGQVASSTQGGFHTQGYLHPTLQNLIDIYAQYNNGCTYLGWSEYVGNERVLTPEQTNATVAEIQQDYQDILERPADADGISHYQNYTNDFVREDLQNSQEYKNLQANKTVAAQAAQAAAEAAAAAAVKDAQPAPIVTVEPTASVTPVETVTTPADTTDPVQPITVSKPWYQPIVDFLVYIIKNVILGVK